MKSIKAKAGKSLNKVRKKYNKVFHGNCCVLLYHRVAQLETDPQLLAVTPGNFESHLAFLKQNYHVLTTDEFTYHLENELRFHEKSVFITFDDGYADNFTEALPILERQELQALFYIATGTLNTKSEFWWDAVERIILLSHAQPSERELRLGEKIINIENLTAEKRFRIYSELLPVLRRTAPAERERMIEELAKIFQAGKERESHRAMTFYELKKMHASKSAVIGAHTHRHPSLAALSYEEQHEEIASSKRILEEALGEPVTHFSYPFGTHLDYDTNTQRIVRELDFRLAAANYPDPVHSRSNRFAFPRFLVRDWDISEFRKQMDDFTK